MRAGRHSRGSRQRFGPYLNDNGGSVVEDNRFDGDTPTGIQVAGDNSVIRRSLVFDTGGGTSAPRTTSSPASPAATT
jgi:hypothetical protein